MRLTGLNVVADGPDGRVQVTVADSAGNQATYQYNGRVYSSVSASNDGGLTVYLSVNNSRTETLAQNSRQSLFDS